jgi:type IV pilus assembly protein PilP
VQKRILATAALYGGVGLGSLGLALTFASHFVRAAHSQTPDTTNVDPEVMKQLSAEENKLPAQPTTAPTHPGGTQPAPTPQQVQAPGVPTTKDGKAPVADKDAPPDKNVPSAPADKANPADKTANIAQPIESFLQTFDYDPSGRRDPFALPERAGPVGGQTGPILPLQRYDIDQLRLTGIIWDVLKPKAMVRDPAGQVHIISPNDKLGKNNGYVAVIREGEIVVVEPLQDEGRVVFSTKLMKLAK